MDCMVFNPLPDDKMLDSSKLKEFADDNLEFDENGRKLSKWEENDVGKGEIACYEQFLIFRQVFSKSLFPSGVKRCHCVGMGLCLFQQYFSYIAAASTPIHVFLEFV